MALPLSSKMPEAFITTQDKRKFNLLDLPNMFLVVSVVPRIAASISQKQSKFFEEKSDEFENVIFITISTDTVEEQTKWIDNYRINNMQVFSDFDADFGKKFEIYDEDTASNKQSVFIFDQNRNLVYQEFVENGTPNFDASMGQLNLLLDN